MAYPFIGQVEAMGFNFAPRGWSTCEGQLLSIASNTALFSLLGTTYGGDGRTTFALPDLRGRFITGQGHLPGGDDYSEGMKGGTEQVTLLLANLPSHFHDSLLKANQSFSGVNDPQNQYLGGGDLPIYSSVSSDVVMHDGMIAVGNTGSNMPVTVMTPYLTMYYCIATQGIFPSRG